MAKITSPVREALRVYDGVHPPAAAAQLPKETQLILQTGVQQYSWPATVSATTYRMREV